MRIVASKKIANKKESELEFYKNYSKFIFKSLKKQIFQNFLTWILKKERIEKKKIKDIQIRMFPSIKQNGKTIAGKCKSNGVIFLYPKKRSYCQKTKQKINSTGLLKYLQGRGRATLIHELLHIKYENDEKKVKNLTKQYYSIFHKKIGSNPLVFKKYNKMIFNY